MLKSLDQAQLITVLTVVRSVFIIRHALCWLYKAMEALIAQLVTLIRVIRH